MVDPLDPGPEQLKIPHMGWNELIVEQAGASGADRVAQRRPCLFVHSYAFMPAAAQDRLASTDYGGASPRWWRATIWSARNSTRRRARRWGCA
ncbi:MAG: hypothetical protein WDO24_29220 [Pseudomonadota bacterium]